jgi:threonine aldolase
VDALKAHLDAQGVVTLPGPRMRLVTHLDVNAAGIDRAVQAFAGFFRKHRSA